MTRLPSLIDQPDIQSDERDPLVDLKAGLRRDERDPFSSLKAGLRPVQKETRQYIPTEQDKTFLERVYEGVGPIGRGVGRAGEEGGQFIVNLGLRGASFVPGLEGANDIADHRNRVLSMKRAYDKHLDETGLTASVIGPGAASFSGEVSSIATDILLTGGALKATKLAKSPKSFMNWFSTVHGAREIDRSITRGSDLGLKGGKLTAYAGVNGALVGGLMKFFGQFGQRLGVDTAEEVMARVGTRAVTKLMTRTGLTKALVGAGLEGTEEEVTELSQGLWGSFLGTDEFDEYKKNAGDAFLVGAGARGLLGSARNIADRFSVTLDQLPDTVNGTLEAQNAKSEGRHPNIPDDASEAYKAAVDVEMAALSELETEVNKRLEPVKQKKVEVEKGFEKLSEMSEELSVLEKQLREDASIESPRREQLADDLASRKAILDSELERLTKQEREVELEELRAKKETAPEREFLASELDRITGLMEQKSEEEVSKVVAEGRQEFLAEQIKEFGLEDVPEKERRSFMETLQRAREKGIPDRARAIASDFLKSGGETSWDSDTNAGVIDQMRKLRNSYDENDKLLRNAETTEEVNSRIAQQNALKRELSFLAGVFYRAGTPQGRSLVSRKIALDRAGELESSLINATKKKGGELTTDESDRIFNNVEEVHKRREAVVKLTPGTKEFDDADLELHRAELKLQDSQQKPGESRTRNAVVEANALWKLTKTALDFSAAGVQGGLVVVKHPTVAIKDFPTLFKALREKGALRIEREIQSRPNADLYNKGYVTILSEADILSRREGDFLSKIGENVPVIREFSRSFRSFINKVRADVFDLAVENNGGRAELTDNDLKALGNFVDTLTGRGGRGYLDRSADLASLAAFAPRYYASQIELLVGRPVWQAESGSKKFIGKEYGRLLRNFAIIYAAGGVANMIASTLGEPEAMELGLDPTSSYFLNFRIGGPNGRWFDPTFKLARWVSLASQAGVAGYNNLAGTTTRPPGISRSRRLPSPKRRDPGFAAAQGIRGKTSLPIGTAVDVVSGRNIRGEKVTPKKSALESFEPIPVAETRRALVDSGMPGGFVDSLMSIFGFPVKPVR